MCRNRGASVNSILRRQALAGWGAREAPCRSAAGELSPRGGREECMKGPRRARMPVYGAGSKYLGRTEKETEWLRFHAPQSPGNSHCAPTLGLKDHGKGVRAARARGPTRLRREHGGGARPELQQAEEESGEEVTPLGRLPLKKAPMLRLHEHLRHDRRRPPELLRSRAARLSRPDRRRRAAIRDCDGDCRQA